MRYNPNIKYCPLHTAADGLMAECSELCGWYIEKWYDEDIIFEGRCAMQYLKAVFVSTQTISQQLDSIGTHLEDINLTLMDMKGGNPCK